MEGLSERAYAAHSGLSRGAVQKARRNGRLVLFADGSINAAASDARRGAMTDPDQQMQPRGGFGAGGDRAALSSSSVSGPGGGRWIDLMTEASILPVNKRPRHAIRLHNSN